MHIAAYLACLSLCSHEPLDHTDCDAAATLKFSTGMRANDASRLTHPVFWAKSRLRNATCCLQKVAKRLRDSGLDERYCSGHRGMRLSPKVEDFSFYAELDNHLAHERRAS